jgi:hypothetical protein
MVNIIVQYFVLCGTANFAKGSVSPRLVAEKPPRPVLAMPEDGCWIIRNFF